MRVRIRRSGAAFLVLMALTLPIYAQAPKLINYQGKLNDGANPANGSFDITVAVYDVASGGTALYAETHSNVQVTDGLFNIIIGSVTPLPDDLFTSGGDRFLGITVDNDSEMTPRFRFASTAYSLNAGAVSGSNLFPADGSVGIGTMDPTTRLEVVGRIRASGPTSSLLLNRRDDDRAAWTIFSPDGNLRFFGEEGTGGLGNAFTIATNGHVGIGTEPQAQLHVGGTAGVDGIMFPDGTVQTTAATGGNGAGDGHSLDAVDGDPVDAVFVNEDGTVTFSAGIVVDGAALGIFNNDFRQVVRLDFNNRQGGVVSVQNSVDSDVAFMTNNVADGGLVAVTNPPGTNVVEISTTGSGDEQAGFISVKDATGAQTAGINGATGEVFGNSKSFLVPDPDDPARMIKYTSLEGPEAAIYVRGKARLVHGRAEVTFPDHFRSMAVPSSITVTLTPRSLDSKGLAAVDVSEMGMKVGELAKGTGNYLFDYVVYGVRKGYENYEVYVDKTP